MSAKRRVTVRLFKKMTLIDIREFYDQGGEMKPGKKGISLTKDQWTQVKELQESINSAIDEL